MQGYQMTICNINQSNYIPGTEGYAFCVSGWEFEILTGVYVRAREFGTLADDLLYRIQEVALSRNLPARTNGKHPCLGRYRPQLRASGIGAKSRNKVETDVAFHAHTVGRVQ